MAHVAAGAIIPIFNVLVFVVIQTLFFWFIASEEAIHVLLRKVAALSEARRILRRGGQDATRRTLDTLLARVEAENHRVGGTPADDERRRAAANWRLVTRWIGPWVVAAAAALAVCVAVIAVHCRRTRTPLGSVVGLAHWVGLGLVGLAYVGEVLLFVLVIDRYVIAGDFELVRHLLGVIRDRHRPAAAAPPTPRA